MSDTYHLVRGDFEGDDWTFTRETATKKPRDVRDDDPRFPDFGSAHEAAVAAEEEKPTDHGVQAMPFLVTGASS